MFGFLKRLYQPSGGYRCDGCNRWTPRREGKALVRRRILYLDAIGKILPPARVPVLNLYCPACAVEVKAGEAKDKEAATA